MCQNFSPFKVNLALESPMLLHSFAASREGIRLLLVSEAEKSGEKHGCG